ncbi:MAG: RES family NAD+ phosphorylase [Actinoallomurus sp.]
MEGRFERHVSENVRDLTGTHHGGRWGAPGAYSVLYLGRPVESVVVEAYRHLVDCVEGMRPNLVRPRRLLHLDVRVSQVLDLRLAETQEALGLTADDLLSAVGAYERCQRVGAAAHQLSLHGLIAPAATGVGETLALFEAHLPPSELPVLVGEEAWEGLPADPRRVPRTP